MTPTPRKHDDKPRCDHAKRTHGRRRGAGEERVAQTDERHGGKPRAPRNAYPGCEILGKKTDEGEMTARNRDQMRGARSREPIGGISRLELA